MSHTTPETATPDPIVSVLVSIKGQRSKKARINKEDLDNLLWGGCTSRWFLGCRGDNVLVHTPDERIVPVCALIMNTPKGKRVVLKDGDPFNLTRENLELVDKDVPQSSSQTSTPLDTSQVLIDEDDLNDLQARGITGPWSIGEATGQVIVQTPPKGRHVPVAVLIMQPKNAERVIYKDGNPLNLTRENLALGPRPITDLLPTRLCR